MACARRRDAGEHAERLGALGQNRTWGAAPARRDPYTAAMVFLKEARRLHTGTASPRRAARLAASVQGEPAWRYAMARRDAERIVEHIQALAGATALRGR